MIPRSTIRRWKRRSLRRLFISAHWVPKRPMRRGWSGWPPRGFPPDSPGPHPGAGGPGHRRPQPGRNSPFDFGANDPDFADLTGFATNPCLPGARRDRKIATYDQGRSQAAYPSGRGCARHPRAPGPLSARAWLSRHHRAGCRRRPQGDEGRRHRPGGAGHHDAGRGRAVAVPLHPRDLADSGDPAHRPGRGSGPHHRPGNGRRRLYRQALFSPAN